MRESGEALVSTLGITEGSGLDVGCGDGTTAVPAAQLGGGDSPRSTSPATSSRRATIEHEASADGADSRRAMRPT
jgi:hypothetical protein